MYEEFSEKVWGQWPERNLPLRILVVNALGNWWSYCLTIEAALRLTEEGHQVDYLDLAPDHTSKLKVNSSLEMSKWRYRQPQGRISSLLKSYGVRWVDIDSTYRYQQARWVPSSLDELLRWQVDGRASGKIIAAAVSGALRESNFDPCAHKELVAFNIGEYQFASAVLAKYVSKSMPDLVLTTNDRYLTAATALSEARANGVDSLVIYWGDTDRKCATYEHSLYDFNDWRSHIRGAWTSTCSSQRYLSAAARTLDSAADEGLPSTAAFRTCMGTQDLPSLPSDKKILTFFPTTPWEYSGLVTRPAGYFENQIQAVRALLKELDFNEWVFVLRHHPPRDGDRSQAEPAIWDAIRAHPSLIEISADSGVDSYKLIDASDVVAVWVSTIGVEAIARGKPVIVMGEPYWLDPAWGIAAPSAKQLTALLNRPRHVEPQSLLPYLCYMQAYGSPLRHVSGVGADELRLHGKRVFPRTLAGAVIGWLKHWWFRPRQNV